MSGNDDRREYLNSLTDNYEIAVNRRLEECGITIRHYLREAEHTIDDDSLKLFFQYHKMTMNYLLFGLQQIEEFNFLATDDTKWDDADWLPYDEWCQYVDSDDDHDYALM